MRLRPRTPLIRVTSANSSNSNSTQATNDHLLKNFHNFMKKIISDETSPFLKGDKNIVRFTLSQYLNIPENELEKLTKLSIIISNDYGLLNQFGMFLPSLKILKLNNSNILSFSDIGTNFTHVRCLQMKNCHLKDISGLICMTNLEILDLEDNEIYDVIDIEMCSELRKINFKKNLIKEPENLTFLTSIEKLEYLCLKLNPICKEEIDLSELENKGIILSIKDDDAEQDIVTDFDGEKNNDIPIKENEVEIQEKKVNFETLSEKKTIHNIIPIKKEKILIYASSTISSSSINNNLFNKTARNNIFSNIGKFNKDDNNHPNNNTPLFKSLLIKKNNPLKPIKLLRNNSTKEIDNNNLNEKNDTNLARPHICQLNHKLKDQHPKLFLSNKNQQGNKKIFLLSTKINNK